MLVVLSRTFYRKRRRSRHDEERRLPQKRCRVLDDCFYRIILRNNTIFSVKLPFTDKTKQKQETTTIKINIFSCHTTSFLDGTCYFLKKTTLRTCLLEYLTTITSCRENAALRLFYFAHQSPRGSC